MTQAEKERRAARGFHAGRMLRAAREFRGLTQAELAERSGYSQSNIAQWEGRAYCSTTVLVRLAEALGLEIGLRPAAPERRRRAG